MGQNSPLPPPVITHGATAQLLAEATAHGSLTIMPQPPARMHMVVFVSGSE